MSRINFKIFTLSWWQLLLGVVLLWFAVTLWPIKGLLWPSNWWGNTLVVVLNDSEARPCGGFATGYGVLQLPIFDLSVNNSYALGDFDMGPSRPPLDQVADLKKFWDLGTDLDPAICAQRFENGYEQITGESINRTILLPLSFLEKWSTRLGNKWLFAEVTQLSANVDRHDEASLEIRKNPAGDVLKKLVKKTIFVPWNWSKAINSFAHFERNGELHWSGYSRSEFPEDATHLLSITEWNLGGGKSSRYLRKQVQFDLRETQAGTWEAVVNLHVTHLGGYNEPLSQIWQGQFEVNIFGISQLVEATINPGESWAHTQIFPLAIAPMSAQIYTPPLQDWAADFSVSVVPQQRLRSDHLKIKESVGTWSNNFKKHHKNKTLTWEITPDNQAPFLTLHKPINPNVLAPEKLTEIEWNEGDLVTELHFNEPVKLIGQAYTMELTDRNFAVPSITENLTFQGLTLLDDQVTLLISWPQNQYQKDERFYLNLGQIEDVWGNSYVNKPRTVITR